MIDFETGEILVPFVRSAYNYDMDRASDEAGLACADVSRTQQQFKEDADINTIVERFGLTGELPKDVAVPQAGDFLDVPDFQSALNLVIAGEAAFARMPADVRKRFGNDPVDFMAFVNDSKNRDEAIKLGLVMPPPAAPEPIPVRMFTPTPVPPATD